ncbi:MAG: hypothetical protein IJC63_04885 [Myxococcaceae bacterium]|nr:hypothetical protein [Myxococcaceae bacterium]
MPRFHAGAFCSGAHQSVPNHSKPKHPPSFRHPRGAQTASGRQKAGLFNQFTAPVHRPLLNWPIHRTFKYASLILMIFQNTPSRKIIISPQKIESSAFPPKHSDHHLIQLFKIACFSVHKKSKRAMAVAQIRRIFARLSLWRGLAARRTRRAFNRRHR